MREPRGRGMVADEGSLLPSSPRTIRPHRRSGGKRKSLARRLSRAAPPLRGRSRHEHLRQGGCLASSAVGGRDRAQPCHARKGHSNPAKPPRRGGVAAGTSPHPYGTLSQTDPPHHRGALVKADPQEPSASDAGTRGLEPADPPGGGRRSQRLRRFARRRDSSRPGRRGHGHEARFPPLPAERQRCDRWIVRPRWYFPWRRGGGLRSQRFPPDALAASPRDPKRQLPSLARTAGHSAAQPLVGPLDLHRLGKGDR